MAAITAAVAVTAASALGAAKVSANAASNSVTTQTASANEAARLRAKSAADQLAFAKEQAAQLRADTAYAQQANYGQWAAGEGNEASQFNINNRFNVGATNATMANAYNQFKATRDDRNARYTTRAGDMSNLRAMLGGQTYDPAAFDELAALERVKAEQYDPTIPDYQRNPNIPPPSARS
jgi:hypothetical protein|tara:strand:- start:476 stop:1015 length:540 start_codon:yes stop_codon:yes gene_type:complete